MGTLLFIFFIYPVFSPFLTVGTQGSRVRALVVVLADSGIISAWGQHVVTSPGLLSIPARLLRTLSPVPRLFVQQCETGSAGSWHSPTTTASGALSHGVPSHSRPHGAT
jgi:hypothetical protein